MNEEIEKTISVLCKWIQRELKNASSDQTESILPAVIEATAKLVDTTKH
ncbi:hypothetical protein HMPREF9013_1322 [Bulleidia extructa W1219]|uniref:Uncharacterized protein n=1 Tax=Bulleidia extructa W1219 TaxID=679192 RepID=D2MPK7_9FIRM|nr:hypothetical protein [Bulleidia extructa]EFC05619.1 hypothetical protein HMPREF9013_1322 [Bulleidia extructa W1219]